jgi:hypothetical protein
LRWGRRLARWLRFGRHREQRRSATIARQSAGELSSTLIDTRHLRAFGRDPARSAPDGGKLG